MLTGIILRWPLVNHEAGIDSFSIHNLINPIVRDGSAPWIISPLDFFGAYALSYPVGYPLILGEVSAMTGFSIEAVILLGSFACGALAALTAFILALEVRREPLLAFLISIAYSTSPLILFLSSWTATTRSIFISLLPLTVWILIKSEKLRGIESERRTRRTLQLLLLLDLVLMLALHRLAFMLAIFLFAYFIWRGIDSQMLKDKTLRFGARRGPAVRAAIVGLTAVVLVGIMSYASYSAGFFDFSSFEEGALTGSSSIVSIINVIASVGLTIGYPLAFVFPIAVLFFYKDRKWDFLLLFFIFAFILLLPFAGGRIYDRMIYPTILLPLIMIPFFGKAWPRLRKNYKKAVVIAIAATLPMNLVFVVYHYEKWPEAWIVNDGNSLSEESYSTGLFAEYYMAECNFVGNNWVMNMRFQSVSGCFEIPNALAPTEGTNLLLSGLMTKEDLNYQLNSLGDILGSQGGFFSTDWNKRPQQDWVNLMLLTPDLKSGSNLLRQYNVTLMLEDARIPGKITGWQSSMLYPIGEPKSPFMSSVHSSMYKIYDNGREYLWLIAV